MMKKTSFWVIVITMILAVSAGVLLWQRSAKKDHVIAEILVSGECVRTVDLSDVDQPETFQVHGVIGDNTVRVEPGRICVTDADCPDHVCIRMGWLSADDPMPIVCLPNEVVIQLADNGEDTDGIDGVTG